MSTPTNNLDYTVKLKKRFLVADRTLAGGIDPPVKTDGTRILGEQLWLRGIREKALKLIDTATTLLTGDKGLLAMERNSA